MTQTPYKFAIIGLGPRGGYALECLITALQDTAPRRKVHIYLFEETDALGSGPVYRASQPDSNWINITESALDLPSRPAINFSGAQIPAFPSYHDWAGLDVENWPESRAFTFPPRGKVGKYLNERCTSLLIPLQEASLTTLIPARAEKLELSGGICHIKTDSAQDYQADDVLLTIGHQPTEHDAQLTEWRDFAQSHESLRLHQDPYPVRQLQSCANAQGQHHIAIRGYGLAMMDAARAIAQRFGSFSSDPKNGGMLIYTPANPPLKIAPFSLDGLTMGPKPVSPKVDAQYAPPSALLDQLEKILSNRANQQKAKSSDFLIEAMAPIIAQRYRALKSAYLQNGLNLADLEKVISDWLKDPEATDDMMMPKTAHPAQTLQSFIDMSHGRTKIYLDYCIGQVWRHCQPIIYSSLSYSALSDDVIADIIALDERSKRYSFGPPVESLEQLKALHDAGVLNLDLVNDPTITCGEKGWTLSCEGQKFTASTMINSVLDSPAIEKISAPLILSLLDKDLIQPVHDALGVVTDAQAYVISGRDDTRLPIAVLGRIAKGTVIGVDAILECFGERPVTWAKAAVNKLTNAR